MCRRIKDVRRKCIGRDNERKRKRRGGIRTVEQERGGKRCIIKKKKRKVQIANAEGRRRRQEVE